MGLRSPDPRPREAKGLVVATHRHGVNFVILGSRALVGRGEGVGFAAAARSASLAAPMGHSRAAANKTARLALDLAPLGSLLLFGFLVDITVSRIFHVLLVQVLFGLILAVMTRLDPAAARAMLSHFSLDLCMSPIGMTKGSVILFAHLGMGLVFAVTLHLKAP